jgi:hypothetical protein
MNVRIRTAGSESAQLLSVQRSCWSAAALGCDQTPLRPSSHRKDYPEVSVWSDFQFWQSLAISAILAISSRNQARLPSASWQNRKTWPASTSHRGTLPPRRSLRVGSAHRLDRYTRRHRGCCLRLDLHRRENPLQLFQRVNVVHRFGAVERIFHRQRELVAHA